MAINIDSIFWFVYLVKSKLSIEIADFHKSSAFLELKFEEMQNVYRTQSNVVKHSCYR